MRWQAIIGLCFLALLGCSEQLPKEQLPKTTATPHFSFQGMRLGDEATEAFKAAHPELAEGARTIHGTLEGDVDWYAEFNGGKLGRVVVQFPQDEREAVLDMYATRFGVWPQRHRDLLRWEFPECAFIVRKISNSLWKAETVLHADDEKPQLKLEESL